MAEDSVVARRRGPLAAAAVLLPIWLHVAWLALVARPLTIFVSPAVSVLLNATWFIPVGLALIGAARGWVRERVIWALIVVPYAALLTWAVLISRR